MSNYVKTERITSAARPTLKYDMHISGYYPHARLIDRCMCCSDLKSATLYFQRHYENVARDNNNGDSCSDVHNVRRCDSI